MDFITSFINVTSQFIFWRIFIVLVPFFNPTPHSNHGKNQRDLQHLVEANANFGKYVKCMGASLASSLSYKIIPYPKVYNTPSTQWPQDVPVITQSVTTY